MKFWAWLLLLFMVFLIAAGGAFALKEVWVLQVVNTDRTGKLNIRITDSIHFTLSYIHSIYLQPAWEEFEAGETEDFILRGVRTRSPAVAAYYGFEEGREYYPVNRPMKSFALRLGMSQAQTLSYGVQTISLGELGGRGDRLEIRVRRMNWGSYLLSRLAKESR